LITRGMGAARLKSGGASSIGCWGRPDSGRRRLGRASGRASGGQGCPGRGRNAAKCTNCGRRCQKRAHVHGAGRAGAPIRGRFCAKCTSWRGPGARQVVQYGSVLAAGFAIRAHHAVFGRQAVGSRTRQPRPVHVSLSPMHAQCTLVRLCGLRDTNRQSGNHVRSTRAPSRAARRGFWRNLQAAGARHARVGHNGRLPCALGRAGRTPLAAPCAPRPHVARTPRRPQGPNSARGAPW